MDTDYRGDKSREKVLISPAARTFAARIIKANKIVSVTG